MFKLFARKPRPVVATLAAARLTPGSPQNTNADPNAWADSDHRTVNR
jgi:hypothetical protein